MTDGADPAHARIGTGYGPPLPDPDGILALPARFPYRVPTHTGRTTLESGESTPSPDGRTLYANIQDPGILLAIRGPWKRQGR
ncbi:hypothetical protein ACIHJG_00635 [Streptomyces sp. NPDC052415]|uniref:hypothetical protein n=1 Tax=Streptomyces sp. NPDC052415 TaxID=3365690 RepID=UPI0037D8DF75